MRVCELTGKRRNVANNVSHAHNKTKKIQNPNLQWKRIFIPEAGSSIRMRLATSAIRSINRVGLEAFCRKLGVDYKALVASKLRS
jgi:large subunit ribosomal protein L28